MSLFYQLEVFVDKAILDFHSFNKINDSVATQYSNTIYYLFNLNDES